MNLAACLPNTESTYVVFKIEEISRKNDNVLYRADDKKNLFTFDLNFVDDRKKFNVGDTLSFEVTAKNIQKPLFLNHNN